MKDIRFGNLQAGCKSSENGKENARYILHCIVDVIQLWLYIRINTCHKSVKFEIT